MTKLQVMPIHMIYGPQVKAASSFQWSISDMGNIKDKDMVSDICRITFDHVSWAPDLLSLLPLCYVLYTGNFLSPLISASS